MVSVTEPPQVPTACQPVLALLTAVLLFSLAPMQSRAQRVAAVVDSTASIISYTGSATMHDWTGTSRDASGTLLFDLDTPDSSRVRVQVPVASFESGPDRRDRKMREVTEADRYPHVTFQATNIRPRHWGRSREGHAGQWAVSGNLTFHGQTHSVNATVDVRVTEDSAYADAQFPVSLTRFGVERPELLWVDPIADTIRIDARLAGARREQPAALERLDTTQNEVTGTRRISSTDLRAVSATRYAGSRAGLHTAVRMPSKDQREWIVALYGFSDRATGLADASTIVLRADGKLVRPLHTTGSTRQLDDGTTVEITRMRVSRSAYRTLASALSVTATVGSARFALPWHTRHDLRLALQKATSSSSQRVSANEPSNKENE